MRAWMVRRMGSHERWGQEVVLEVRGCTWRPDPERGGGEVRINPEGACEEPVRREDPLQAPLVKRSLHVRKSDLTQSTAARPRVQGLSGHEAREGFAGAYSDTCRARVEQLKHRPERLACEWLGRKISWRPRSPGPSSTRTQRHPEELRRRQKEWLASRRQARRDQHRLNRRVLGPRTAGGRCAHDSRVACRELEWFPSAPAVTSAIASSIASNTCATQGGTHAASSTFQDAADLEQREAKRRRVTEEAAAWADVGEMGGSMA